MNNAVVATERLALSIADQERQLDNAVSLLRSWKDDLEEIRTLLKPPVAPVDNEKALRLVEAMLGAR